MRGLRARDRRFLVLALFAAGACAHSQVEDFEPPDNSSGGSSGAGGGSGGSFSGGGGQSGSLGQAGTLPTAGNAGSSAGGSAGAGGTSPFGGSAGVGGAGGSSGSAGASGAGGGTGGGGSSGASGSGGSAGKGGSSGSGGSGGSGGSAGKGGSSGSGGSGGGSTGDCTVDTATYTLPGGPTPYATTKNACLRLGPPQFAPFSPKINAEQGTADGYPIPFTVSYCGMTLTGAIPSLYTTVNLFTGEGTDCEAVIKFGGNGDALNLRYYAQ